MIKHLRKTKSFLKFILDWFVTQQQIKIWYDYYFYDDDYDEVLWWYKGYKKRKEQKAQIQEELLPIAWHPNQVMDWCILEDEKKQWKAQKAKTKRRTI